MFYSQLLLSKKAALGIIWMAAHCHKRLKKDQVQQTNISSSVDKILDDEVPVVTHRILAFLLLGIVRIYSKKVEYLFDDCHEILNRLFSFKNAKTRESAQADVGVSHTQIHYNSITLPKRFELDTFDLGLVPDSIGGKVRSRGQDTLADWCRKDSNRRGLFCKNVVPIPEAYSTDGTPPRDVLGIHRMDQDLLVKPSRNVNSSLTGVEILRQTHRSFEDFVDPVQLNESEQEHIHYNLSNENQKGNYQDPTNDADSDSDSAARLSIIRCHSLPSSALKLMVLGEFDKVKLNKSPSHDTASPNFMLHGIGFTLEDRLEPMVLDDAEKELLYDRPSSKSTSLNVQEPVQEVELHSVENQSHAGENPVEYMEVLHESCSSLEHSPNFNVLNSAEKRDVHDKPTNGEHGAKEKHIDHLSTQLNLQEGVDQVSTEAVYNTGRVAQDLEGITQEIVQCQKLENFHMSILNTQSNLPVGVGIVEVAAVQTPGRKERAKILKKRKALVDVALVVPNKVLKSWIEEDPIDLKRKRNNIPHTLLQVWRAHKLCYAPHSFLEPSIPGVSVDFDYYGCGENYALEIISAKPSVGQEQIPDIATEKTPYQTSDVRSPIAESLSGQAADVVTSMVLEKPPGEAPVVRSPIAENYSDQIPMAPGTPIAHLKSFRSREAENVAHSDILEPSMSLESIEKCQSSNEQLILDTLYQEETSSYEGNSFDKDAFSARTRTTASYLCRKFLHKKRQKEEEVINLSRLLAGKTKKESTIMFYEILVLKTRDCIDVQQETPHRDILVRETPKLRQYFQISME